jgi:hypothetical protein
MLLVANLRFCPLVNMRSESSMCLVIGDFHEVLALIMLSSRDTLKLLNPNSLIIIIVTAAHAPLLV